ncbi:tripartite tricarboxylate transporter TctB family protein [Vibrio sp. T187]|uniref:tripartite tricarboxylate transporter TctB family protein n=1 Tax=Vibrio TaxID=662 RepID=UPI0010CA1813|nr:MULTISPECIES: tripartite tricarboxylate transporter TctB family protein [Vibrio]MBW3694495.1 tripartite tricarboxylate transporter TctB family protein [Vibrio sp. T187]
MRLLSQRSADFAVVILLAAFVCWYTLAAWQASTAVENLILIVPIASIALIMCLAEMVRQGMQKASDSDTNSEPSSPDSVVTVLPIIALFSGYVLSLETIGFDIATTLFVGAFLWLQKERRLVWVVGYSVAFGLLMSTFFAQMLPYPMPMSLLPTEY